MSDVRALLKAKRQEARVNHPLASYSEKTEGHLGSKGHRTTALRLRQEEQARDAQRVQEEKVKGKRKADEESSDDGGPKRRKVAEEDVDMDASPNAGAQFPNDFFSDPSRGPIQSTMDESDDEAEPVAPSISTGQATDLLDLEWQKFQQAMLNPPDEREKYDRATVFAEPEMASETPQGFPSQAEAADAEIPKEKNEEQIRRQKEEDERELIMDRLMDEERAQEDADMRVSAMKAKLDALKKKREAAKAAKKAKS
ncbi:hypothetical protein HWV62_34079 [Athelia sp. TMB]|nr:hypothetical protein HWV62_34079 [Athelia sp. TMB]